MKTPTLYGLSCSLLFGVIFVGSTLLGQGPDPVKSNAKPLKALLVAGGCCHDYKGQHEALFKGIQTRANVQVDVWWTDDKSVNPPLPIYDDPNWAKGYDIIIHDECAAGNRDLAVLKRILDVHKTIPSVQLHCAMHSFRGKTDQWFKHIGIQSSSHGPQEPIDVKYVEKDHPIVKGLEDWTTIKEELYNNVDVFDATPLAMGTQKYTRDGKEKTDVAIVAWTNETQGARSFSTTLGHNTETVADDRYLNLVVRGLLWACDKLNGDYLGKAYTGKNKITFLPKVDAPKEKPQASPGEAPKDALLAKVTASSEESGKSNFAWKAIDGNAETRWCANSSTYPHSISLEFDKPQKIHGASIKWESSGAIYSYLLEYSMDGKPGSWGIWIDGKENQKRGDASADFAATDAKFVRVTVLGANTGNWASIREIGLKGAGFKSLFPKLDSAQAEQKKKQEAVDADPYAKEGNITPKIVKLTEKEEADILGNVKVPGGFDVTVFSDWRGANYPVYVAAAPNGDLYVSSDGNGSLGREPHRGRVLRLRDTDKDGRADEVTEFVKDVDSPRGLLWDHDRLYLLHPPHISVYTDKDGDGVAEESKKLIDGIAFGFEGRPADHTTNDITMGIDGWIYIAGGDFGFMKATGTDGRELQHRGGGVIRFRPDGSGLELFATGTRNILGTPVSPLLDMFARDNTNDGGGWDVRLHHFTGLEDHGYPRLYKNFPEEHVHPLADYGGGSGCGAVYIHEPGFPDEWNKAPFTADWGTGALYRHSVQRVGATFEEITEPQPFIKMTRPTDGDVDGMSAVYQASWRGPATFKWAGPETGYIVRVTPKDYTPEPLPDFEKMSDAELVAALESPSRIRTMAAQRALLRRDKSEATTDALIALASNTGKPLEARVAATYAVTLQGDGIETLQDLMTITESDVAIAPFTTRALGDLKFPADEKPRLAHDFLASGLESQSPRRIAEAIVSATRQDMIGNSEMIAVHLASEDPMIAHLAFRSLAQLGASEAALELLASETHGKGAAFALMRMHDPEVVDILITGLKSEKDPATRSRIISILARLAQREAEWTGDSWGTRPDTRGPYYQLAPWSETEKILASLKSTLNEASPDEATHIIKEMSRNRIQSNDAMERLLKLSGSNPEMIPEALKQLAVSEEIPAAGVELIRKSISNPSLTHESRANAVTALSKTDDPDTVPLSLAALAALKSGLSEFQERIKAAGEIEDPNKAKSEGKYARQALTDANKQLEEARTAFLDAPALENHHLLVEELSSKDLTEPSTYWANAALLSLASRKFGSPESIEMTRKTLDLGWKNPQQRVLLIKAAAELKNRFLDDRIRVAMNDADSNVAKAAKSAAKALKIQAAGADKTPKIGTLDPKEALAAVIKHKGNASLGEAVFARATCSACHTVSQDEPQKGPYLGNIFETYKRPELAEAIIDPNKTIAQGFATNVITPKEGNPVMGFVTDEQGDQVTLRDIASAEHVFKKSEIKTRETLPMSIMPPALMNSFTVHEMASLLDYLELLSAKK
ncbi:ThuA domain-containing protein [Verrucomicrobiales bacterium BCK34]|nr:ThuA domain-containing protein [Verrucomicrobiales bacterium BCK34]